MPRQGPERIHVSARVSEAVRADVRHRAALEHVTESEIVRRAVDQYLGTELDPDELRARVAYEVEDIIRTALEQWKDGW